LILQLKQVEKQNIKLNRGFLDWEKMQKEKSDNPAIPPEK